MPRLAAKFIVLLSQYMNLTSLKWAEFRYKEYTFL